MWVEVPCWIECVWSSNECASCVCDPSVHLSVPVYVFCMLEVISSFKSLRAGSHVFAFLMGFCMLCGRVIACSCYASCPLVCCACLPSV